LSSKLRRFQGFRQDAFLVANVGRLEPALRAWLLHAGAIYLDFWTEEEYKEKYAKRTLHSVVSTYSPQDVAGEFLKEIIEVAQKNVKRIMWEEWFCSRSSNSNDLKRSSRKQMIKVENQKIEKQVVILDGYHYKKCTFIQCQLIFSGMGLYGLEDCNISPDSGFGFNGPAQNTLNFLSAVHRSNPNGRALVEAIFQLIRAGLPPQPVPAPQLAKADGSVN
jgi:hypothetical protein